MYMVVYWYNCNCEYVIREMLYKHCEITALKHE